MKIFNQEKNLNKDLNKNNLPNKGWIDWRPALEIFNDISIWIIIPIILALIFGKMLDKYFGTKPWIFIGLIIISFLISSLGIVNIVKKYIKNLKKEEKKDSLKEKSKLKVEDNIEDKNLLK